VEWKDLVCIGRGKSRKDAEMNAAHRMIELINERIALDTLK
jgi:dsRNA-specific ribonuclease